MRFVFRLISIVIVLVLFGTPSSDLFSQTKALKEINISYPLGGSSSFFWIAYRSGSFERHGLRLKPIFIPGGVTAGLGLGLIMIFGSLIGKKILDRLPEKIFVLLIEGTLLIAGLRFLIYG